MKQRPVLLAVATLTLLLAFILWVSPAGANNPIATNSVGTPFKWTSFPIMYTTDGGALGALDNAAANGLTATAFTTWTGVATASLSAAASGGVLADGNVDTFGEFQALGCVGVNPIVYDHDGSITDGVFGGGASDDVLGFAGPCSATGAGVINGGLAVMNGKLITSNSGLAFSRSKGVFIHELGHFLGLGHSQVNLNCLTSLASCPSNTPGGDIFGVPTMFPTLLDQTQVANTSYSETLTADDISAISTLYPNPNNSFTNDFGTISGRVLFSDTVNGAQGINVIARRVGDPRVTAISNVSGSFARADHGNPALPRTASNSGSTDQTKRGEFTIPGLPPGTYQLEIESIRDTFFDGSNVGPVSDSEGRGENIPIPSPAVAECFGGPESNTDNPATCQNLDLTVPGTALNNRDFILNEAFPAMDAFDTTARNESIGTATLLGDGTISASLSGNSPDVDFYALPVAAGFPVTIETRSKRLTPGRFLDSVIDLMNAAGTRFNTCRIGDTSGLFNQPCVDDDFISTINGFTRDSKLEFTPAASGTIFLRITDAYGDSRPDFLYELTIAGSATLDDISFTNGGGDNLWTNPANWDLIRVPVSGDRAIVGGAFNVTLNLGTQTTSALSMTSTGTLTITGMGASLTVTAPSTATNISVANASLLTANGPLNISGTLTVNSTGAISGSSNVTIASSGQLVWSGGSMSGTGQFINNGTANITGGTLNKTFTNTGTANVNGGTLQINFPGIYTQTAGLTQVLAGATIAAGTTIRVQGGTLRGAGTVTGTGGVLNTLGTVAPGLSPGTFGVSSSYTQGIGGSLSIEIGGLTAGTQYDQLNISGAPGTVSISNSTLTIALVNGFVPAIGHNFTIITSTGARSGTFATVNTAAAPLPAGRAWLVTYNANSVVLDVVVPSVTLSSSTTNFGNVQVGTTQAGAAITLTNIGAGALTISSINVTGTNLADFSRATTCPLSPNTLAAAANCTITPSMNPQTGATGARSANISIAHNAAGSPHTIALSGAAVDFAMSFSGTPPAPVTAGGTSNFTINFSTAGGNSLSPITFGCSGLPSKSSCVFTPSSLPAGSSATTVNLAISTTATVSLVGLVGRGQPPPDRVPPALPLTAAFGAIGALSLLLLAASRPSALPRFAGIGRLCLLALVLVAGGYLAGCATGSDDLPGVEIGTPPGNYTVTVTATAGAVQRSTTVNLVVQ